MFGLWHAGLSTSRSLLDPFLTVTQVALGSWKEHSLSFCFWQPFPPLPHAQWRRKESSTPSANFPQARPISWLRSKSIQVISYLQGHDSCPESSRFALPSATRKYLAKCQTDSNKTWANCYPVTGKVDQGLQPFLPPCQAWFMLIPCVGNAPNRKNILRAPRAPGPRQMRPPGSAVRSPIAVSALRSRESLKNKGPAQKQSYVLQRSVLFLNIWNYPDAARLRSS